MLIEQVNVQLKLISGIRDKWLSYFFIEEGRLVFVYISCQHVQHMKYKKNVLIKEFSRIMQGTQKTIINYMLF